MARFDSPLGVNPLRGSQGNTIPAEPYNLIASDNCAPGTIVYLNDAGTVTPYTGTTTGGRFLLGAAMGYVATADTDRAVLVSIDPNQEYEVQQDSVGSSVTALTDMLGANFTITAGDTVHTTLIQSRAELDSSSVTNVNNTTTVRPFKALRFARGLENVASDTNSNIVVRINAINHHFGTGEGVL